MTGPDDPRNESPRDRFRNILSADKETEGTPEPRKPAVVNLPKPGGASSAADAMPPRDLPDSGQTPMSGRQGLLQKFWTAGAILSVVANFLLLMVLIGGWVGMGGLISGGSGAGALEGLYAGLEELDQAHIKATIPVQTTVALDASVPVKTSTNITLSKDVMISGAHVTINTALFNIDAPAAVTLPAGTSLDVALDMTLPMQSNLPISVDVPIDIAISETDLHAAIQRLQASIKPVLCSASPGAVLPDGTLICR